VTADADLDDLLAEARRTGEQDAELVALDALARRTAQRGDHEDATRLLDAADRLHAGLRHLVDDADRSDAAWVRQALAGAAPAR
jgi:hypothetical protein